MANDEIQNSISFESDVIGADVQVDYTEEGLEVKESRDNDFGRPVRGGVQENRFEHFVCMCADILGACVDGEFKLTGDQEFNCIALEASVENRNEAGCLFGSNMKHLNAFFVWARAQQVFPHSKIIKFVLHKRETDEREVFWDYSLDDIEIYKNQNNSGNKDGNDQSQRDRQSESSTESTSSASSNSTSSGRRGVRPPK